MATRKILGPAVRAIREAMGVRHGVLADQAQLSPGYLTLIEQGRRKPTAEVIGRIATALGVGVEAISYFAADDEENAA